jgi:hypothetical protein
MLDEHVLLPKIHPINQLIEKQALCSCCQPSAWQTIGSILSVVAERNTYLDIMY